MFARNSLNIRNIRVRNFRFLMYLILFRFLMYLIFSHSRFERRTGGATPPGTPQGSFEQTSQQTCGEICKEARQQTPQERKFFPVERSAKVDSRIQSNVVHSEEDGFEVLLKKSGSIFGYFYISLFIVNKLPRS